jgi:hypothetical protein
MAHVSVQCQKLMVALVCNPMEFCVTGVLLSQYKFDDSHSRSRMLGPTSEWQIKQTAAVGKT